MHAHWVGQLLGLDFNDSPHVKAIAGDPGRLRSRALQGLGSFFKAQAERLPAVLLLEDIHWADDSSLDAFGLLENTLAEQPVLIVYAARPTLFEQQSGWKKAQQEQGAAGYSRIDLRLLSRDDSRRLVEEILQKVEHIPEALHDLVVGGAEGNPFYLEELLKMLVENGAINTGGAGAYLAAPSILAASRAGRSIQPAWPPRAFPPC